MDQGNELHIDPDLKTEDIGFKSYTRLLMFRDDYKFEFANPTTNKCL